MAAKKKTKKNSKNKELTYEQQIAKLSTDSDVAFRASRALLNNALDALAKIRGLRHDDVKQYARQDNSDRDYEKNLLERLYCLKEAVGAESRLSTVIDNLEDIF